MKNRLLPVFIKLFRAENVFVSYIISGLQFTMLSPIWYRKWCLICKNSFRKLV